MAFLYALPGAVAEGLIWGLMAIGVYISYKILDIADLTVDGSICTGACICAVLMALGVPVVSTPTDGLLDLIDEGENGYLSGDDAVLAERIVQIANDPALRQKLSRNDAEKAIRINDMETYKKAVAALYARCIGAKKVE